MAKKPTKAVEPAEDVFKQEDQPDTAPVASSAYVDDAKTGGDEVAVSDPAPNAPTGEDASGAPVTYVCVTECRWQDTLYKPGDTVTVAGTKAIPSHFKKQ